MPTSPSIFGYALPGGYNRTAPDWWSGYGGDTAALSALAAPQMDAASMYVIANEMIPWLSPVAQRDVMAWLTGENYSGVAQNLPANIQASIGTGLQQYAGGTSPIPQAPGLRDWFGNLGQAAGAARTAGQQLAPYEVPTARWLQQLGSLNSTAPKTRSDWMGFNQERERLLGQATDQPYEGLANALLGEAYVKPTLFSQPGRKYAAGGINYWG